MCIHINVQNSRLPPSAKFQYRRRRRRRRRAVASISATTTTVDAIAVAIIIYIVIVAATALTQMCPYGPRARVLLEFDQPFAVSMPNRIATKHFTAIFSFFFSLRTTKLQFSYTHIVPPISE